jgi:predicted GIY-YIG superfamily endonuclease
LKSLELLAVRRKSRIVKIFIMSQQKNYWLYVLKLEHGKFYVGITTKTPEIRFREHLKGIRPAYWTRKYKPITIIDAKHLGMVPKAQAEAYENKVTREYMKKKGINSVRGGDLKIVEDYAAVFGYIFERDSLETILIICFLILSTLIMVALNYLK